MGKSWKEKPGKYRDNRDFQKKQKQKHKHQHKSYEETDSSGYSPFSDTVDAHESFS